MSGIVVLFRFMQLVSVVVIALRMIRFWEQTSLFSKSQLPKIGTIMIASVMMVELVSVPSEFWRWVCLIVLLGGFHFGGEGVVFQRENHFREQWHTYLERLLLRMRGGTSLRSAMELLEGEEEGFSRAKLAQIRAAVVFSQHDNEVAVESHLAEVVRELRLAAHQPHQSSKRLVNLKRKLRIELGFRRRSGQVLLQMRLQAGILAALYLAMLVFVLWQDRSRLELRWLLASVVLFAVGTLWLLRIGRGMRWKV